MNKDNLTIEQQQKLKDLGANLNQIRLAKNISLDTIAANTHISKRLLEAIEAGNFEELPEPFYIKALVSKFARQIGAEEICFEVESRSNSLVSTRSVTPATRRSYWGNFQLRSLHLYLIYILLVIVSLTSITKLVERPVMVERSPEESPASNPQLETVQSTSTPAQQPKTTSQTTPQFVSQSSNSETVSVGINLQERCWLKVMVDGRVAFEGTLPQGTQRQWTGKKQVTIKAGNAGGVVISFNNEQQKILGAPGQVEEITYTVN